MAVVIVHVCVYQRRESSFLKGKRKVFWASFQRETSETAFKEVR